MVRDPLRPGSFGFEIGGVLLMSLAERSEASWASRNAITAIWAVVFAIGFAVFVCFNGSFAPVAMTFAVGIVLGLIAVHDERTFTIPDLLVLLFAGLALTFQLLTDPRNISHFFITGFLGLMSLWAMNALYRRTRGRSGIGFGDAKLFAAIGLLLGIDGLMSTLLWSVATALVLCLALSFAGRLELRRDARIAFGSHLAFGAWMTWLFGPLTLVPLGS
jgi:prepilin signal peptidase PulO-like enzyme (type II secretory pathway)